MSGRLKAECGSGNVFSDLGFPGAEAENLLLRSQLMSEIRDIAKGLTQAQAAKRLVVMLNKAGMHVEMRVRKAA